MSKTRAYPKCEICNKEIAMSFSWFDATLWAREDGLQGWYFTGMCTADCESYYVEFADIFDTPWGTVDWLAHLADKPWFCWLGAYGFSAMLKRMRGAGWKDPWGRDSRSEARDELVKIKRRMKRNSVSKQRKGPYMSAQDLYACFACLRDVGPGRLFGGVLVHTKVLKERGVDGQRLGKSIYKQFAPLQKNVHACDIDWAAVGEDYNHG